MNDELNDEYATLESQRKTLKVRPLNLLGGIILGTVSGLAENVSDLEVIANGGLGMFIPVSTYFINRADGRPHDASLYNSEVCLANYGAGYILGYLVSNVAKNLFS